MRISTNKVFLVDIRRNSDYLQVDDKTVTCPSDLIQENVIVIKFNHLYATIKNCRNMITYLTLKRRASKTDKLFPDSRLLHDFAASNGCRFITNFRPLFEEEKYVTLKSLYKMQKEYELTYKPSVDDLDW